MSSLCFYHLWAGARRSCHQPRRGLGRWSWSNAVRPYTKAGLQDGFPLGPHDRAHDVEVFGEPLRRGALGNRALTLFDLALTLPDLHGRLPGPRSVGPDEPKLAQILHGTKTHRWEIGKKYQT